MDSVGAGTFGKPLLVELSHAVERFALADGAGGPSVVIAMFQELAYFRSEAEVYRRIAASGAVTVVGLRAGAPVLPEGVRGPDLPGRLVVPSRGGPPAGAPTAGEAAVDPSTSADVDAVLRAVAAVPEPAHEAPWEESLRFLTDRLHVAISERAALAARLAAVPDTAGRDPHTGFETTASLDTGSPDPPAPSRSVSCWYSWSAWPISAGSTVDARSWPRSPRLARRCGT